MDTITRAIQDLWGGFWALVDLLTPLFFDSPTITAVLLLLALFFWSSKIYFSLRRGEQEYSKKIDEAEAKLEMQPERMSAAWDLARVTLQAYFNRNLSQVTLIFWLTVVIMIVGFMIIVFGIVFALQTPQSNLPAIIAVLAGVITEFVGATFLLVYRSTMQQAVDYTKTLERINLVGMAMQILDTIRDDAQADSLKNVTKAAVVKALMMQSYEVEKYATTDPAKSAPRSEK